MAEQSLGGKLIMAKKKLFPNLPETAKASKYMLGFIGDFPIYHNHQAVEKRDHLIQ